MVRARACMLDRQQALVSLSSWSLATIHQFIASMMASPASCAAVQCIRPVQCAPHLQDTGMTLRVVCGAGVLPTSTCAASLVTLY